MTSRPTPAEWNVAVGTGLLRVGVGAALLRYRSRAIRLARADSGDRVVKGLFTYFGVRDVAVGLATLAGTRPGSTAPPLLVVQGAADTADAAAIIALRSTGRFPGLRGLGLVGLAAGTAVVEYAAALALRRRIG